MSTQDLQSNQQSGMNCPFEGSVTMPNSAVAGALHVAGGLMTNNLLCERVWTSCKELTECDECPKAAEMVNIFITGATGYVGGQALHAIVSSLKNENIAITCLIRDTAKADQVLQNYPNVRIVPGDLEDDETIEKESSVADIVLHAASFGHLKSAKAIAKGLAYADRTNKPGYWIQISGATLFTGAEVEEGKYGAPPGPTLDDLNDVDALIATIKSNSARAVESLVMSQDPEYIRTALVVGPLIYGPGQGPVNQRSIQGPEIARVTLQGQSGIRPGDGSSQWCNIHIRDIGKLFVSLVQAAMHGRSDVWNDNGMYIPENGIMSFGQLCELIAEEATKQGYIKSSKIDRILDKAEADKATSRGSVLWGTNAAFTSGRARTRLSWTPSEPSLAETIPELVSAEAKKCGIA